MEKMKLETSDLSGLYTKRVGEVLPEVVTEIRGKDGEIKKVIDFEKLKTLLTEADEIAEPDDEKYEFTWVGKKESMVEANKPIRKTLRPCKEESKDWDNTENLYIEGDNLEVLKLLQESYLNKVKMIYIDPPYNTGNDFIYNDDFKMDGDKYKDEIGEVDEEGNRLFKNTDSNGRFHSDWCSMMYSRLMLARNLLSEDGVIAISIDDNEYAVLKQLCDEVFGEENFINTIAIKMSTASGVKLSHRDKKILKTKEYVILFSKDKRMFKINPQYVRKNKWDDYYEWYVDKDGTDCSNWSVHKLNEILEKNNIYNTALDNPKFQKFYFENANKIWQRGRNTSIPKDILKKSKENWEMIFEYKDNKGNKQYCYKGRRMAFLENVMKPCIDSDGNVSEDIGTLICDFWDQISTAALFSEGGIAFPNGKKPQLLLITLIMLFTNKDDIVLDFFSGSASTAEAVLRVNNNCYKNNKFIMVQIPEECNKKSEIYKAGFKNVCEIGKERIRRAGEKIKAGNADKEGVENLDIGFRVLKVDDTNMKDVYYTPDEYKQSSLFDFESNIKDGRTELDLLYGCLIDWGLPLNCSYRSEELDGNKIHIYNIGDLIACFDENISEETIKKLANMKPLRVVFRDSSFKTSAEKINVKEIFKLLSPETSLRVI